MNGADTNSSPQNNFSQGSGPASLSDALNISIGNYVVCEFLIGTDMISVREGIVTSVGTDYFILYDEINDISLQCDFYSLKFTYFYAPGDRPEGDIQDISKKYFHRTDLPYRRQ